jgi:S1-C subfamily serine protease
LGSGSGFVWDFYGHIVTNYHVVRNAAVAQVAILTDNLPALPPSTSFESSSSLALRTSMRPASSSQKRLVLKATVVGVDPSKDVAVLKVDAPRNILKPISVGSSDNLKVGQQALAIGNPFGLDHTLTSGIISGTGRQVTSPSGRPINNVIQTDAAINPGNSGGPLLDSTGKLIGMNTAIYSPSGGSAGIGFAIPISTVKMIVETLIRDGQVVRPVLGISFLESRQAKALGINSGVLVLEVPEGSAASKAGLRGTRRTESGLVEIGDIITKVGTKVGTKVIDSETDLFQALEECKPGDVVKVTVSRVIANEDQLTVREVVLSVQLQSSVDLEKSIQRLQYQAQ